MALVSFHIRSSFNEDDVSGLSTMHWLWGVVEPFEGLTLPFVISSWTKAAVVNLVSGVNTLPSATESWLVSVVHVCPRDGNRVCCWPSEEWRIWWRPLGIYFLFSLWSCPVVYEDEKRWTSLQWYPLSYDRIWYNQFYFTLVNTVVMFTVWSTQAACLSPKSALLTICEHHI